jgi:hypothetical protein
MMRDVNAAIKPDFSAIGMKCEGGMAPKSSSCHRASASRLEIDPLGRVTIGWKTGYMRPVSSARRKRSQSAVSPGMAEDRAVGLPPFVLFGNAAPVVAGLDLIHKIGRPTGSQLLITAKLHITGRNPMTRK